MQILNLNRTETKILNDFHVDLEHLIQELLLTIKWKRQVKTALTDYWTRSLVNKGRTRSTLHQCCLEKLEIGKVHRVWNSVRPNLKDVRRAHTKARILTGTYSLQSTKAKFNNQQVDPKCPLCRLESEYLTHFLLRCPALSTVREPAYQIFERPGDRESGPIPVVR